VVDAAADIVDAGLTDAQKTAACKPADAADLILTCACAACPVQAYDCFFATDLAGTQCRTIMDCVNGKHATGACTDTVSCAAACLPVIQDASSGYAPAQNIGSCLEKCVPETGVPTDAPAEVSTDAPAEVSTDAPAEAAPDAPVDAPVDADAD
jgi:hypothetical protein